MVEAVQHVQPPERSTITESISHDVRRPRQAGRPRHRQCIRFFPFQPLARLDPQVQPQVAEDATNAFVVSWVPFAVAQVQETKTEPPSLAGIGQPDQQIGDLRVLGALLWACRKIALLAPQCLCLSSFGIPSCNWPEKFYLCSHFLSGEAIKSKCCRASA